MQNIAVRRVRQTFEDARIADVRGETLTQIKNSGVQFRPGERIAIATGSRGVGNIAVIVAATVQAIKDAGAEPFIVPAMGSHAGATAEGQRDLLAGYGITEDGVGAPVVSSMNVKEIDSKGLSHRVYMDEAAYQADGVVAINRVKVHTDFHGPHESGVMKMLVIGLGKHAQALEIHSYGVRGLRELIPVTAKRVIETGKIRLGIGICENAYDETAIIKAMLPNDIESGEKELLAWNREHMPSLPSEEFDILIIDRMGKDMSGAGIDTNIIGRMLIDGEPEPLSPRIGAIILDDLTPQSHGNAIGMGLADFITERMYKKINYASTYENVLTSSFHKRGFTPIVMPDVRTAVAQATRVLGIKGREPSILRIRDTMRLDESFASPEMLARLKPGVTVEEGEFSLLTEDGGLSPLFGK